ncbi:unnamed protein product [Macrosiphum euphorbiae]|uniref:Transposable element P transposase-like RNase H C-terminal domain-containing protein n=1 Tax=Macrosiphum euphorbiae TaxID=13131 RepID=A0AAV0Y9H1_9HEMI|nr:unnamed protein product [Macrosiphum euphorbiae]
MTRQLNQDALEHFFGHMRGACGSNSHPDLLLLVQVYRLLSVYSLVKPISGSNVTGSELLSTIISLKDLVGEEHKERKEHFENIIDNIINNASPLMDIEIEDNTVELPYNGHQRDFK